MLQCICKPDNANVGRFVAAHVMFCLAATPCALADMSELAPSACLVDMQSWALKTVSGEALELWGLPLISSSFKTCCLSATSNVAEQPSSQALDHLNWRGHWWKWWTCWWRLRYVTRSSKKL